MNKTSVIEAATAITLTQGLLDHRKLVTGVDTLINALTNDPGGHQGLEQIVNQLNKALQAANSEKTGLINRILLKFVQQEARLYRVRWKGRPDYISIWPIDQDRVSLHMLGYEEENASDKSPELRLLAPPLLLHLFSVSSWRDEIPFPKIKFINWKLRDPIGMGGLAVVYRVSPGVVAKVGRIDPKEAEAQDYFARRLKAVPVWDFQEDWKCPQTVAKEVCPVHGLRPEAGILDPDQHFCTCYGGQDILLMPEADDAWIDPQSVEFEAFKLGFLRECEQELGRCWDARPANVARYLGNLVALDFGEEEM